MKEKVFLPCYAYKALTIIKTYFRRCGVSQIDFDKTDFKCAPLKNQSIKYKIREKRKEQGLTAEALAQLCGLSVATIRAIEAPHSRQESTKLGTLHLVAQGLECNVKDLFEVIENEDS